MDDWFMSDSGEAGGVITCRNSQGVEVHGTVLNLERHRAVFECYNPGAVFRSSEVLSDFNILMTESQVYAGSAVVCAVVQRGGVTVCEATLTEGWNELDLISAPNMQKRLLVGFDQFVRRWQKVQKIHPGYKEIIGDVQTFLTDLRLW